jgi:hypothetical protein
MQGREIEERLMEEGSKLSQSRNDGKSGDLINAVDTIDVQLSDDEVIEVSSVRTHANRIDQFDFHCAYSIVNLCRN